MPPMISITFGILCNILVSFIYLMPNCLNHECRHSSVKNFEKLGLGVPKTVEYFYVHKSTPNNPKQLNN